MTVAISLRTASRLAKIRKACEGETPLSRLSAAIDGPSPVVFRLERVSESLIEEANDSVYALAAGIWSRDFKRAWRLGRQVQAGTVWINTYKQFSVSTPFGGWRDSGLGREKGRAGILQYMEQKSMYWGTNEAPIAWAG